MELSEEQLAAYNRIRDTIQQVIIVRDINNATLKACNELIRLRIKSRKEATIG